MTLFWETYQFTGHLEISVAWGRAILIQDIMCSVGLDGASPRETCHIKIRRAGDWEECDKHEDYCILISHDGAIQYRGCWSTEYEEGRYNFTGCEVSNFENMRLLTEHLLSFVKLCWLFSQSVRVLQSGF